MKEGRRIIEHYTATGEFQSGWAALEKLAMQAGVAWAQRLLIDQVGVSPYNREGLGVAAGDAQKHLVDINHLGFTWTKLEAKAKQTDQHDPEPEIAFNEMQVKLSKGLIPPLSLMLAVSIGGGHTNVGFRQAKHGVKALYKELAGPDGNIDQSKLATGKPEVQDALANGLHWTVFHWQCEDAWPGFSQFAQKSLNTIAQSLRQLCFSFFFSSKCAYDIVPTHKHPLSAPLAQVLQHGCVSKASAKVFTDTDSTSSGHTTATHTYYLIAYGGPQHVEGRSSSFCDHVRALERKRVEDGGGERVKGGALESNGG